MADTNKIKEHFFEIHIELKEGVPHDVAEKMAKSIKDTVRDSIHVEDVYLCELTGHTITEGE